MAVAQFVANTAGTPGSPLIASLLDGLVQATSYVLSGGNPGTSASLSVTVPQTQAVVLASTGIALWANVPSTPLTLTASRDTYLDLVVGTTSPYAGSLVQVPVANGAAAPALTANSVRLCKVVTSGTAATSVVDLRPLSPQATAPGVRQIRTGVQATNPSLTSATVVDWPGGPTISLTTQSGGSLRIRFTLPVGMAGTPNASAGAIYYANVDGTNLPQSWRNGTLMSSTGGGTGTVACVWTTAVTAGPHTIKIQAQLAFSATSVGADTTGYTCLEVEEYA